MSVLEHGPIPDGWERVPDDEHTARGMRYWSDASRTWILSAGDGVPAGAVRLAYIRPIVNNPEPQETTFTTEVKGESVATSRQWIALPDEMDLKTGQKVRVTVEVLDA